MEIYLSQQVTVFLSTISCGIITGFIYELFRLSRKLFQTSDFVVFICDTIFWLVSSVLSFATILYFNSGQLRWFLFAGFIIGGVIYFTLLSGIVSKIIVLVIRIMVRLYFIIKKILAVPLKIIKKPLRFAAKKTRNLKKYGKIPLKKLKSQWGLLKKVRKTS